MGEISKIKNRIFQGKCQHYANRKNVKNAFEFICKEVVNGGYMIDYKKVINKLDDEMSHLNGPQLAQIHWLASSGSSSV